MDTHSDPYRLDYHITPKENWLNDPNGLVFFQGYYHVFYQCEPTRPDIGSLVTHWGHVRSRDLVHWVQLPMALSPSEPYDAYGCWSGSAVVKDGVLYIFYTGIADPQRQRQVQCMAVSYDGIHFTKYNRNPIISDPPPEASIEFRDPKVFIQNQRYFLTLGSSRDGIGKVLLYHSEDLLQWQYSGVIAEGDSKLGRIWETPDLYVLDSRHVLTISPFDDLEKKCFYLTGEADLDTCRFDHSAVGMLDYGNDFYAPQSFLAPDGRRIMFAWMGRWNLDIPTVPYGWAGALTLPREVRLLEDGHLACIPVQELQQLRKKCRCFEHVRLSSTGEGFCFGRMSLTMELFISLHSAGSGKEHCTLTFTLEGAQPGQLHIIMHPDGFFLDTRHVGNDPGYLLWCPFRNVLEENSHTLHIFFDRSSIEIFADGGKSCMTSRFYPPQDTVSMKGCIQVTDDVCMDRLDMWELSSS